MFTEKSKLKDIMKLKNGLEILQKYSIPCAVCPLARMEMDMLEIGQIADMYDIDIEDLLKEINT
jgi:hypothetical protein